MIDKPEDWIGFWVSKLGRALNIVSDKEFQKYDLTGSQNALLHQLWEKDGLTQKEIQENLNLRAASVSGLVDTLLKKGFIYREQDTEDCRCKRLYLTEEGKKVRCHIVEIINEIENSISTGFTEDEKVIFISWMRKLYKNIDALK